MKEEAMKMVKVVEKARKGQEKVDMEGIEIERKKRRN